MASTSSWATVTEPYRVVPGSPTQPAVRRVVEDYAGYRRRQPSLRATSVRSTSSASSDSRSHSSHSDCSSSLSSWYR